VILKVAQGTVFPAGISKYLSPLSWNTASNLGHTESLACMKGKLNSEERWRRTRYPVTQFV